MSLSHSLFLSSPHLDELPVTTDPNNAEKADMRIYQAAAQEVLYNINISFLIIPSSSSFFTYLPLLLLLFSLPLSFFFQVLNDHSQLLGCGLYGKVFSI